LKHNQSRKFISKVTTMFGIRESVNTVVRHYKEGNLNWPMIIYISLAHAAAIIGLFSLSQCHKYTLLWAFILWPIRSVKVNSERK
jgi:cytochrome c oxidase subunit IV